MGYLELQWPLYSFTVEGNDLNIIVRFNRQYHRLQFEEVGFLVITLYSHKYDYSTFDIWCL